MGWFSRNNDNQNKNTQEISENKNTRFDDAIDYFSGEAIHCDSEADKETVEKLYSTLKEDNYDTYNDDSLKDAISSLAANLYNLLLRLRKVCE